MKSEHMNTDIALKPEGTGEQQPILTMKAIHKSFPGVKALDNVALQIMPGEVHGLLGENGAGKSTLMKILSGAYRPDEGTITFNGADVEITSPIMAQRMGIVTIYQEFTLVPSLTVAENVFMGREPGPANLVNWGRLRQETSAILKHLRLNLDPMTLVRSLSVAEQQMVEIARALSMKSKIIIMDEPTSALSDTEVKRLLAIIRDLKAGGISVIFITHHLEEAMEICDNSTVLRDGRNVGTVKMADVTLDDIIRMMVGRSSGELFKRPPSQPTTETALRVRGLTRLANARDPHAIALHDISFNLNRGEILGLAGLVGAGRTEIARAIFGVDRFDAGVVEIDGKPVNIKTPGDAIHMGLGLVPEDRKQQALFLDLAIRENMSMASLNKLLRWGGFMKAAQENTMIDHYRQALSIRMASREQRVRNLSGGNQQKVVIARWLALQPKILIVDEPTRGIDIAAKAEVHQLLDKLAREGIAILMISSELPEIMSMSDRILTIRQGHLTGEFNRDAADEETLMQHMMLDLDAAQLAAQLAAQQATHNANL